MLDAGVTYIQQHGLAVSFDQLPMEEIIAQAQIPRAAAYRQWRTRQLYMADLITETFARPEFAFTFSEATTSSIHQALANHQEFLATASGRIAILRELIRVAAELNLRELLGSSAWKAYEALYAAAADPTAEPLVTTARAIESKFIDANARLYQQVMDTMGLRPRPPHTARTISLAAHIVVTGFVTRIRVEPALEDFYLDGPAVDGSSIPWHMVAHLARHAIEPLVEDPNPEG